MTNASTAAAGLCRLTVRAPDKTFELAVPADVQVLDLLPTIIGYAGDDLDEAGLEHDGWILQRLGEEPLDEESTPQGLGLHDGDVVYVRPRREAMPPVHFDDLVDSVAGTLQDRADTWRPDLSRRTLLIAVQVFLGSGLALLGLPGSREPRILVAAIIGVVLLAASGAASRAMADAVAATVLGVGAVPFIGLAGMLMPATDGSDVLGSQLLAGAAAGAGAAALAVAVVGAYVPVFVGVGVVSLLTAVGGLMMVVFGVPLGHASAEVAVDAVFLGIFVPALAFRLSGLRLPPLPANADQLQEGIEPHDAADVMSRSTVADQYTTSLYLAVGLVLAACLTGLQTGSGWPPYALTGAISLLCLLHGGRLGGIWPRLAVMLPGLYGAELITVGLGTHFTTTERLFELAVVVLVAGGLAIASWTIPGRRLLPHWGHAMNLLHSLAAISLVPLTMLVFGFYHYLRGLGA